MKYMVFLTEVFNFIKCLFIAWYWFLSETPICNNNVFHILIGTSILLKNEESALIFFAPSDITNDLYYSSRSVQCMQCSYKHLSLYKLCDNNATFLFIYTLKHNIDSENNKPFICKHPQILFIILEQHSI